MKAVKAFKRLLERRKPGRMSGFLGRETRLVQPPSSMLRDEQSAPRLRTTRSVETADRRPVEQALAAEGVHRDPEISSIAKALDDDGIAVIATSSENNESPLNDRHNSIKSPTSPTSKRDIHVQPKDHRPKPSVTDDHGKGHAHNPLEDHLFLAVGPYGADEPPDPPAVSESPAAAETNIYETAYSEEIERIRSRSGTGQTLYLTRRVEKKEEFRNDQSLIGRDSGGGEPPKGGLGKILGLVRKKEKQKDDAAAEQEQKEGRAAEGQ